MPRVPEYQSQVAPRTPALRTPTVSTQPQAAFGEQEAEANAKLGAAISQAGQALSGIAEQRMKMNAEKEALKLSTDFQTQLDEMLYSPDIEDVLDENENVVSRPRGILNQKRGQLKNAGVRFDVGYGELLKEFEGRPKSEYEKAIFTRMEREHYTASRNSVFRHQAREEAADYRETIAAGLERIKQSAVQFVNADDLLNGLDRAQAINETGMRNMGRNEIEIEMENAALVGEIAQTTITALLENEPMRAQAIFEAVKGELSDDAIKDINEIIAGKTFADQRVQVWDAMGGLYRRADGSYDKEAMRAGIMGLPGFDTDKKEKLVSYAEARANDSEAAFRKGNAANDRAFLNKIIKMQSQGIPLDERLKVAAEFGRDEMDIRSKENAVKKMQDTVTTNKDVEWELRKGIRRGEITMSQLEDNQPSLSGTSFGRLRNELNKSIESPQSNIATRSTWDRIESLAERNHSNRRERNEYLTELAIKFTDAGGGSPDQLWKMANDELRDVKTKWYQFGVHEAWRVDAEKNKALSLLKGQLETDLGREAANEIMFALRRTTDKDAVNTVGLNDFIAEMGGIDALRPGTPGGKAVQLLMREGKLATPEAVRRMIEYHPEWK
jgi:hypothetical protein